MTVAATGTQIFEMAKHRMLNKMGKKTSLTKNERVDYVTPRLDEIKNTRKEIAALFKSFRAQYRKTLLEGTQLNIALITAWSNEVGERSYVPEIDSYIREKSLAEQVVVQEVSDDIRTVMESIEKISAKYDKYLRREGTGPFGENDGETVEKFDAVINAKDEYRITRTKHSDSMINYKLGFMTGRALETVRQEYEVATADLETKMADYEKLWHQQLFAGMKTFFQVQTEYLETVSCSISEMEVWSSNASTDVLKMRQDKEKNKNILQLRKDVRIKASENIRKARGLAVDSKASLSYTGNSLLGDVGLATSSGVKTSDVTDAGEAASPERGGEDERSK